MHEEQHVGGAGLRIKLWDKDKEREHGYDHGMGF
jgi:hypothetical protein